MNHKQALALVQHDSFIWYMPSDGLEPMVIQNGGGGVLDEEGNVIDDEKAYTVKLDSTVTRDQLEAMIYFIDLKEGKIPYQQLGKYKVRIQVREEVNGCKAKPEALALNGREAVVQCYGAYDEGISVYGEKEYMLIMIRDDPFNLEHWASSHPFFTDDKEIHQLASGDVVMLELIEEGY
jgi:ribosomal protein L31